MFMAYLLQIQTLMDVGSEGTDILFDAVMEPEERRDEDIKKDILSRCFQLKVSFLFASKAAELYNNVSSDYIVPGIKWLSGLRLAECLAEDNVQGRLEDIERQRLRICFGAEELARKTTTELENDMDSLFHDSLKSLQKAAAST